MKLALLAIPVTSFLLALKNKQQSKKLKFSGKVPNIHAADRNYHLFSLIGMLTLIAEFLYFINLDE